MAKEYRDLLVPYDPYPVKPPKVTRDGVPFEPGMTLWHLDSDYDSLVYELESIETAGMELVLEPDARSQHSYWFLRRPGEKRPLGCGLHIEELYAAKQNAVAAGLAYYGELADMFRLGCQ